MTFVGKVLVVVQLVLSLTFLAFAGAVFTAQNNWKKTAEARQKELTDAQGKFKTSEEQLRGDLMTRTAERDKEKIDKEQSDGEVLKLKREMAPSVKEKETLETERSTLRAQATISSDEATQRREEAKLRLGVNKELHLTQDELLVGKRKMEDEIFAMNVERQSMIEKHNSLLDKLDKYQRQFRALGVDPDATVATKEAPPPVVEGIVLNTKKGERDATEFIEISIGSDDGLLKGHDLFVYRNDGKGKFLGKIRLVMVTPDRAVGTVIEKARNGVIQQGDNVTSKL